MKNEILLVKFCNKLLKALLYSNLLLKIPYFKNDRVTKLKFIYINRKFLQ